MGKKILIIKLGALGDIIASTPIMKQIQAHHQNDELWLMTSTDYSSLFMDWPGLNVQAFARRGISSLFSTIHWLRQKKFHRVFDLQSNDKSRILVALSNIPGKIGNHNCFPYNIHPGDRYTGQSHMFERHNKLLESAGIAASTFNPWLPIPLETEDKIDSWIKKNEIGKNNFIIIHAGSSPNHLNKRWPYFDTLATETDKQGLKIIWIGTNDDAEINRRLSQRAGIDATNAFTIAELICLGKYARCAISNDSGPMHALACSNIPVYGLFGPTDWRRHHAVGQKQNVIHPDDSNANFNPASLDCLTAEQVMARLNKDGIIHVNQEEMNKA